MPKKTIAQLKKDLDKVFAAYIRKRDSKDGYFVCISCGQTKTVDQMHAGHFYARTFTATRWNEANVNGQCAACNTFKHGNLLEYRRGMLSKYGQDVLDLLEKDHTYPTKLDRESLEFKIGMYKNLQKSPSVHSTHGLG